MFSILGYNEQNLECSFELILVQWKLFSSAKHLLNTMFQITCLVSVEVTIVHLIILWRNFYYLSGVDVGLGAFIKIFCSAKKGISSTHFIIYLIRIMLLSYLKCSNIMNRPIFYYQFILPNNHPNIYSTTFSVYVYFVLLISSFSSKWYWRQNM